MLKRHLIVSLLSALIASAANGFFTNTWDVTLSNNYYTNESVFKFTATNLTHNRYGENEWLGQQWQKRIKVLITNTMIAAPLTNFPVLVRITNVDVFTNSRTYGEDLRFTSGDGTNLLPYELELWDAANTNALVWVKVPVLSSTTNTVLYFYYNNTNIAANPAHRGYDNTNAWDSNFNAVWHLDEAANGTAGEYKDSTKNAVNGTGAAGLYPLQTNGLFGKGQHFSNGTKYATFPLTTGTTATVSAWAMSAVANPGKMLWCFKNQNPGPDLWIQNNSIYLNIWDGNGNPFTNAGSAITQQTVTNWHYYTVVIQSPTGNTKIYIDGKFAGTATAYRDPTSTTFALATSDGSYRWNGFIDEARVSGTARDTNWIAVEYTNMVDTLNFAAAGIPESLSSMRPTSTPFIAPLTASIIYDVAAWTNFAVSNLITNGGAIFFQLATNDYAAAGPWFFYSNNIWNATTNLPVSNNTACANTIPELNTGLTNFFTNINRISWRACYLSDGTNELYTGNISLGFLRHPPTFIQPSAGTPDFRLTNMVTWNGNSNLFYTLTIGTNASLAGATVIISNVQGNAWPLSNLSLSYLQQDVVYYVTIESRDSSLNLVKSTNTNSFIFRNTIPNLAAYSNKATLWLESPAAVDRSIYWAGTDSDVLDQQALIFSNSFYTNGSLLGGPITNIVLTNVTSIDITPIQAALSTIMTDGATIYWRVQCFDPHGGASALGGILTNFYLDVTNNTPDIATNLSFTLLSTNSINTNTVFYWNGGDFDAEDTVTYNLQFLEYATTNLVVEYFTTNTNARLANELIANQQYVIRVRGNDQKGLASSQRTNWSYWTNGTAAYFFYDTSVAPLNIAYPAVGNGTLIDKNGILSWSNVNPSYSYRLEIATNASFSPIISATSNISGSTSAISSIANFTNISIGVTNYYRLISISNDRVSPPSSIFSNGIGSFRFQDDANPLTFAGGTNRTELFVDSVDPTNYTLFFNGSDANASPVNFTFTFYTNTNAPAVICVTSNVAPPSFDIRLISNYAALPDNIIVRWEVTDMRNSHGTVKSSFSFARDFFLNKTNDAPDVTNVRSGGDGRVYLNDPLIIQGAGDPDIYDIVSNEFVISRYPTFPGYSLFYADTLSNMVYLESFRDASGTVYLTNSVTMSNDLYLKVRSFDNRGGSSAWVVHTNTNGSSNLVYIPDIRLANPVILTPTSTSVTNRQADMLVWSNVIYLPATNTYAQPLYYAVKVGTNSNFTGATFIASDITNTSMISMHDLGYRTAAHLGQYYFTVQVYYGAGNYGSFGTNVGAYTFYDDNAPSTNAPLITTNEIYAPGGTNERFLRWLPSFDADGDDLVYDLYLMSSTSGDLTLAVSTNTNITNSTFLDISAANGYASLSDNTSYYVIITNIRDTHGRAFTNDPPLASYKRDFLLNKSNDNPNAASNITVTNDVGPVSNYALVSSKARISYSATDPDTYDNASLTYRVYIFTNSTNTFPNITNTNNYDIQKYIYRLDTAATNVSLYDITASPYRDFSDTGLSNGRPFILGIQTVDRRSGESSLWIYSNILVYTNYNQPVTNGGRLIIPNGYLNAARGISWTNGADPDDTSLFYQIDIADSASFTNIAAAITNHPQNGTAGGITAVTFSNLSGYSALVPGRAYFIRLRTADAYGGAFSNYSGPFGFYYPSPTDDLTSRDYLVFSTNGYTNSTADRQLSLSLAPAAVSADAYVRITGIPYNLVMSDSRYTAYRNAFRQVFPHRNIRVINAKIFELDAFTLAGAGMTPAFTNNCQFSYSLNNGEITNIADRTNYRLFVFNTATTNWDLVPSATAASGNLVYDMSHFSSYTVMAYADPSETISDFKVYPSPVSLTRDKAATIYFVATKSGTAKVQIFNAEGYLVREIVSDVAGVSGGTAVGIPWDGTDSRGFKVATGAYVFRLIFGSIVKVTKAGVKR